MILSISTASNGFSNSDWAIIILTRSWRPVNVFIDGRPVNKRMKSINSSASTSRSTCLTFFTIMSSNSLLKGLVAAGAVVAVVASNKPGNLLTKNLIARLRTSSNSAVFIWLKISFKVALKEKTSRKIYKSIN